MSDCLCGCGESAKNGNRYIHGHNSRADHPMRGRKHSPETLQKLSESHRGPRPWRLGWKPSDEIRKKMSESHKGVSLSEKHRKSLSSANKKKWADKCPEDRARWAENISKGERGKPPMNPEALKRMAQTKKGKRYSPATEFTSEVMKERYRDPAYVSKMKKAWGMKPTKPEACLGEILNDLYPDQWKYTGDFSLTINGKCPDFVNCNGQKKIIELFGDYWHRGQAPQDRIDAFKPFGFDTLVIWEHELKDMGNVIAKIHCFMEG